MSAQRSRSKRHDPDQDGFSRFAKELGTLIGKDIHGRTTQASRQAESSSPSQEKPRQTSAPA